MTVFTTKTWSGDYHKFLQGEFASKILACDFAFDARKLFVNNGVPCDFKDSIKVEDYTRKTLKFFNLSKEDFKGGYWYSIEELTELYLLKDYDYICHYASDCISTTGDWITEGLEILQNEPETVVVSPRSVVNTWHNKDGYDQFFSDQCYLIPVKWWRQQDFSLSFKDIAEYPSHGGDSFEKKCAQIMRLKNKRRKVFDDHWYEHC